MPALYKTTTPQVILVIKNDLRILSVSRIELSMDRFDIYGCNCS